MLNTPLFLWRRAWDSNPRGVAAQRFSRPPRYDHFDTAACMILWIPEGDQSPELKTGPPRYVLLRCPKSFARSTLARFRPLPLFIARCIRRRRREPPSPLRYRCIFTIVIPRKGRVTGAVDRIPAAAKAAAGTKVEAPSGFEPEQSRICSPLPYHLAMAPLERATRFELATSTLARWRSAK